MYACVCLFTNFIQFWVWLKMVERPPHDHFAGKMMKNNLLELGVSCFQTNGCLECRETYVLFTGINYSPSNAGKDHCWSNCLKPGTTDALMLYK